jgi:hypothetical protein
VELYHCPEISQTTVAQTPYRCSECFCTAPKSSEAIDTKVGKGSKAVARQTARAGSAFASWPAHDGKDLLAEEPGDNVAAPLEHARRLAIVRMGGLVDDESSRRCLRQLGRLPRLRRLPVVGPVAHRPARHLTPGELSE